MKRRCFLTQVILLTGGALAASACARRPGSGVPRPLNSGGENRFTEVYRQAGGQSLRALVHVPARRAPEGGYPTVIFFHGGAWLYGRAEEFAPHCRRLAQQGVVAISVEYRTKLKHAGGIAAAISDARAAMRWARGNAKRLGIDPNRIAAAGTSVGAHLALATELLGEFEELEHKPKHSSSPQALLLFAPVTDTRMEGWPGTRRTPLTRLRYDFLVDGHGESASPIVKLRKPLPPTLIIHAEDDRTVPIAQSERFVETARELGSEVDFIRYERAGHRFVKLTGHPAFNRLLDDTDSFLRKLGWIEERTPAET